MKLAKCIPARTKTITANWCSPFMEMTARFREIRSKSRNKMDKCYWCTKSFANGDVMHLANFQEVKAGNQVLCKMCAKDLTDQASDMIELSADVLASAIEKTGESNGST